MIGANELKKKSMILIEGEPFLVLDVTVATPTARGASTMVKARVRNLKNGAVLDKNFKSGEKFAEADVEKGSASLSYIDPEGYHFLDEVTYEEFVWSLAKIGDLKGYLKEGSVVQTLKYNGIPVSFELPVYVELTVASTEPSVRGDTAGNVLKPARLETGLEVKVPQYIKEGDRVRVHTQTGEVDGRA